MSTWPRLVGANRDYLMGVLPHVAEMIVPKISDATAWADTVVVTSADPVYAAEIATLSPDKVVLDFAQFHRPPRSSRPCLPVHIAEQLPDHPLPACPIPPAILWQKSNF